MTRNSEEFPFVSIIVPVYNGESTIKNCLEYIFRLKYPREKLEVTLIDDGSTDKTLEIAKEYPVRIIQNQHGGYPTAMNTGIKVAKGEIVVNIDADTYITEDWLSKIVSEFKDPSVGIASGYIATLSTSGFWARMRSFMAEDRYDKMKSKYVDFITSTCTAYRKNLFEAVGLFDGKLSWNCDEDLSHRAFKKGWKILLVKEAICYHDCNPSFKNFFSKQILNARFFVKNAFKSPELLRGKWSHPSNLYVPVILTFLLVLMTVLFLVNYASPLEFSLLVSALFLGLLLYHLPRTIRILRKHRDWTMILFPVAVNLIYVAWLVGLTIGIINELMRR